MPLKEDLLATLEDQRFHDVVLVGTDGVEVPATKHFLAARSPYWNALLVGEFREATEEGSRVSLPFPSTVLKVLVWFCCSDELEWGLLFATDGNDDDVDNTATLTEDVAVLLVKLRNASDYFELPEAHVQVTDELVSRVLSTESNNAGCVCSILAELLEQGEEEGALFQVMMAVVEARPNECLLLMSQQQIDAPQLHGNGIHACPLVLVSKILERNIEPLVAVKCLQELYDRVVNDYANSLDSNNAMVWLRGLASKIDLKSLAPNDLAKIEHGGLFTAEQLLSAHKEKIGLSETSQKEPKQRSFVVVVGAGVDSVNGVYESSLPGRCYVKSGMHPGTYTTFKVEILDDGCWGITSDASGACATSGTWSTVREVIYKSPQLDQGNVPFGGWLACGDNVPAPFVALLHREKPFVPSAPVSAFMLAPAPAPFVSGFTFNFGGIDASPPASGASGLFGAQAPAPAPSFGISGAQAPSPFAGSAIAPIFGATGLFGAPPAPAGYGGFGATAPAGHGIFGAPARAPAFGAHETASNESINFSV